jgi:hypothetical protein
LIIVRYADDIIIGFKPDDARRFCDAMRERLGISGALPSNTKVERGLNSARSICAGRSEMSVPCAPTA